MGFSCFSQRGLIQSPESFCDTMGSSYAACKRLLRPLPVLQTERCRIMAWLQSLENEKDKRMGSNSLKKERIPAYRNRVQSRETHFGFLAAELYVTKFCCFKALKFKALLFGVFILLLGRKTFHCVIVFLPSIIQIWSWEFKLTPFLETSLS